MNWMDGSFACNQTETVTTDKHEPNPTIKAKRLFAPLFVL